MRRVALRSHLRVAVLARGSVKEVEYLRAPGFPTSVHVRMPFLRPGRSAGIQLIKQSELERANRTSLDAERWRILGHAVVTHGAL